MARGEAGAADLATVRAKLDTITAGSICSLATQHQVVVGSLLDAFADEISVHVEPGASAVELRPISALIDLDDSGEQLDTTFADKQLDWTYDESDSGKTPVERFTDHRGRSPTTLDG